MSQSSPIWSATPNQLELGPRDIHIWRASLEQSAENVQRFRELLAADELARAARYRFDRDRLHFIVARGVLRTILGRYLNTHASTLEFRYSEYGKPIVVKPDAAGLNFNLAHSGSIALYAFTEIGEVGIDVELIRAEFTGDEIAVRFFSRSEVATLTKVPCAERHRAFFNCWSRKEAFIKAKGVGLSLGLDQFDVSLAPDEPPQVLRTAWDEAEARRWSLSSIDVDSSYAAAVAVEAQIWDAKYFDYDSPAASPTPSSPSVL